jgi:hypothetical protein
MKDEDQHTTAPGHCANCGAQLPPDQPADNRYCERCSAAWRRETACENGLLSPA